MKIRAIRAEHVEDFPRDTLITDYRKTGILDTVRRLGRCYEREELENDPQFRQPIPYVLVREYAYSGRIVMMQRMKVQAETRLHGKFYIGAGGHVEEGHTVFYTALKEVTEELGLPLEKLDFEGVLITTGGMLEDVHLCLFYTAITHYGEFTGPEQQWAQNARWVTIDQAQDMVPEMEKWSQVIMKDYFGT